ncbi:MAG: outer membrane protein assembly factor BamD [Saprospiraceae bacterium]
MKNRFLILIVLASLLGACRSEYEQTRLSNDPERIQAKAVEYYKEGEYQKALSLTEIVINSFRGRSEFEDMNYMMADCYYHLRDYEMASQYFKNFANGFLNSPRREEADFQSAYCYYLLSPSWRLDQDNTQKAINALQTFINTYPNSERITQSNNLMDELRLKLEEKAFQQGFLYYNLRQYQAAIYSLDNMLKDFPDTKRPDEVRYYIIKSAFEYAANSVYDKRKERYEETVQRGEDFVQRHRNSDYLREVRDIVAESKAKLKLLENERYQIQSSRNGS